MNCIVIDDEPLARKGMELLIEQVPFLKLLGSFTNPVEARECMQTNKLDVLFLDIQMPKLNGMDFIKSGGQDFNVIITTAYPQFAVEAFEMDVVDYLVKPIRFDRFYKAVCKVQESAIKQQLVEDDYVFLRTDRKYVRIHYSEMDYIEGLKDYVIVHCGSEKYMVAANLKTILSALPESKFIRISKSYVVNASKIKFIESDWVQVDSKKLLIGDVFKESVLDFVNRRKILKR